MSQLCQTLGLWFEAWHRSSRSTISETDAPAPSLKPFSGSTVR